MMWLFTNLKPLFFYSISVRATRTEAEVPETRNEAEVPETRNEADIL
jgi:hypothetical protein